MSETVVLTKGQITIPREVREYLNLQPGDKVFFQSNIHREYTLSKEPKQTITHKATLTEKGQVTIPRFIRDEWDLKTKDTLIFHSLNDNVFMRKLGERIACPACEGKGAFNSTEMPCFVCDHKGTIEKHKKGFLYYLFFENKFRKYNVRHTVTNQKLDENGEFHYTPYPILTLHSASYPTEVLSDVQEKLQLILAAEHMPDNKSLLH